MLPLQISTCFAEGEALRPILSPSLVNRTLEAIQQKEANIFRP